MVFTNKEEEEKSSSSEIIEAGMLEHTILSNLIYNEEFSRKVVPYIKEEYFDEVETKKIFSSFADYVATYKEPPSIEALKITLDSRKDLSEDMFKGVMSVVDSLKVDHATNQEWLLQETEKFCQNKDLYNSIRRAILILDGQDKEYDKGSIPKLLSDSLGVSFDTHIGHDYLEDFEGRYEFYHRKEERLPFDIDLLNKITKGGLPRKSLTILLSVTGGGKTLVKCHIAATSLLFGKNVLYITNEMAEERIAERIDSNLLNITLDDLKEMPHDIFQKKIDRVKSKTAGRLVIKEYPTGSAHAGHFRHLINELKLKKNFMPDIIFVDYLNICASSRIKGAAAANSYTLVKSIAEEIRGLAMEFNVPIVSSSQYNRSAYDSSDVDLTNTSESMGIAHTADAIFGLITSEELESMGQIMIKQLKNRWGDLSYYRRFVIGIDRAKMKLYNLEQVAQENVQTEPRDERPVFDKTKFDQEDKLRLKPVKKLKIEGMK
jgi:archaellum biogenesis ATPase FlaH